MQAGQNEDRFWQQTNVSFHAVLKGVRKRQESEFEAQMRLAWHTAAFTGATESKGGLKPLQHYLRKPQTPGQMVAALKTMGAKSDMKIRRVPLKK